MVLLKRFHRFWSVLSRSLCRHNFKLADIYQTGIPEPEKPTSNNYDEWTRYYHELDESDWYRRRVAWPCCKCGKVFYAHCGLDITPKHGVIVNKATDTKPQP